MTCKTLLVTPALLLAGLLAGLLAAACGSQPTQAQGGTIAMQVTEAGFVPDHLKVKKGQPVKLLITRKTDQTCAKEIVIDEYNVHAQLPLNKAVTVAFTPTKSGELKYGCGMNKMVSGVLTVE
jgi:plastocyanin domain-containing protein